MSNNSKALKLRWERRNDRAGPAWHDGMIGDTKVASVRYAILAKGERAKPYEVHILLPHKRHGNTSLRDRYESVDEAQEAAQGAVDAWFRKMLAEAE